MNADVAAAVESGLAIGLSRRSVSHSWVYQLGVVQNHSRSTLRWSSSSRCARFPAWRAEVAVLKNGFSIKHERREILGDVTRLYVGTDGSSFVDVPTCGNRTF